MPRGKQSSNQWRRTYRTPVAERPFSRRANRQSVGTKRRETRHDSGKKKKENGSWEIRRGRGPEPGQVGGPGLSGRRNSSCDAPGVEQQGFPGRLGRSEQRAPQELRMTPATRVARTVEVRRFARRGSCAVSWLVRAGMSAVRWKVNGGKQRQRSRCGRWASRWQWMYRVLGGRVWRVWRHGFPRYRVQAGMVEKGGIGTVGIAKFLAESRPGIQKPPCSIKGPVQAPYSRLRLRIRCSIVCRLTRCSAVPIVLRIVHIHIDRLGAKKRAWD